MSRHNEILGFNSRAESTKRRKKLRRNYSTPSEDKSVSNARTSRRSDKQMDEYIQMRMSLSLSLVSMRFWSQGEAFGSAGGPNDSGHSENTLITVEALPERKHCAGRRALLSFLCLSISPSLFSRMCEILEATLVCLHYVLLQLACKL